MSDQQMQSALDEWFEDTDPQPPNTRSTATRVMAQVSQTRQRGRWLPFRLFRPKAQKPTATDTAEYQPSPIPATNGHTPTVIGRTQSMLSPVKAITAGAIVFAIGGVMLIAQPFDQQADVVPGAEADFAPPAHVTGRLTPARGQTLLEQEGPAGYLETWGSDGGTATSSDPRLEGVLTFRNENRAFDVEGSDELAAAAAAECDSDPDCGADEREDVYGEVSFGASSIENNGGVWRQRPSVTVSFPGSPDPGDRPDNRFVEVYDGDGEYEGLVAVLMYDTSFDAFRNNYAGFIVDARVLPPLPETASAE